MFSSVRARLTLWYTAVLALVLVTFGFATYTFLARMIRQRMDDSLAEAANAFATVFTAEHQEEEQSSDEAAIEVIRQFRFRDHHFIVYGDGRRLVAAAPAIAPDLFASDESLSLLPPMAILLETAVHSGRAYATLRQGDAGVRAFALATHVGAQSYIVVVMRSRHDQEEALEQVRHGFYVAVPLALLLASLGGYLLARKNLAPIVAMSDQAARIGAENLHERLTVANEHDELGHLAAVFNNLLTRLNRSFEQQRRFTADASHELRTPVAIVRGEAEVALSRKQRSSEDYRESLAIILDEGQRLTRIVEDLFTLVRADAGQHVLALSDFYLNELVGNCVHAVRNLATTQGLNLFYEPPAEMMYRGDEELIRRMIMNLLDNAIKYTAAGGVFVLCEQHEAEYQIAVADTGPGIPADAQAHIFERFYRADKVRSRAETSYGGGTGLGLSIARWIAEVHGGRLELDRSDATGSVFIASLPKPTEPA
ncbi:MAG: hypothetical protein DMG06_18275 [Acidobacteria bacterium]|nr:MAG: hypothetical protein DMG06_18275 [Acidobacteriota bacterium]